MAASIRKLGVMVTLVAGTLHAGSSCETVQSLCGVGEETSVDVPQAACIGRQIGLRGELRAVRSEPGDSWLWYVTSAREQRIAWISTVGGQVVGFFPLKPTSVPTAEVHKEVTGSMMTIQEHCGVGTVTLLTSDDTRCLGCMIGMPGDPETWIITQDRETGHTVLQATTRSTAGEIGSSGLVQATIETVGGKLVELWVTGQ